MARKSRGKKSSTRRVFNTRAPLHRVSIPRSRVYFVTSSRPSVFEPIPVKYRSYERPAPSRKVRREFKSPNIMRFYNLSRIVTPRIDPFICARRAIRREVIFANGSAGGRVKRPKFTPQSKVKC